MSKRVTITHKKSIFQTTLRTYNISIIFDDFLTLLIPIAKIDFTTFGKINLEKNI